MKPAPLPLNERERLVALRQTGILDTAPEAIFDQLTDLAARLCGTPIALITLVDVDRQWFKSHHGIDVLETPRDVAFCAYTILEEDLFVVDDALLDERFADNPLVAREPKIRFYAGSPLLTSDGHALGSFCVIDYEPHKLPPEHAQALKVLARHATAMLQLRRIHALLEVNSIEWERARRAGDTDASAAALEALGRNLKEMVVERERSEAALREIEMRFEALEGAQKVRTLEDLTLALEGPLATLVETSGALVEALRGKSELREQVWTLRAAALRARAIASSGRASSTDEA